MTNDGQTTLDSGSRGHVLVVDDDPAVRRSIGRILEHAGYAVEIIGDGREAVERVRDGGFNAIVSDIAMPGFDGIALLRAVRENDLDIPVILVTGEPSMATAIEAVEYGAIRYLLKPFDAKALEQAVEHAVRLHKVADLRRQLVELGGDAARQISDRAGLEARFDRALDKLFMVYQPIVSWSSRSTFGYEALVRSAEPTLPHPGALFDAAERLDRLNDLGRRIRKTAIVPMSEVPESVLLFVNLHTRDLLDESLFDAGEPLNGLAGRVVLEITERARLEQVPDVRSRITRLTKQGFRVAIDDIGAGYAGLTSFALLEPDVVKLDMALVREVDRAPTKQKLIRSLTQLCHEMELHVVAEGVETVAERDVLIDLGCDLFQGYLFAKPGPPFVQPNFG
jgi:EAL domain-containing protein (putative c-di-GMP-specific phosphodiesterase class I)